MQQEMPEQILQINHDKDPLTEAFLCSWHPPDKPSQSCLTMHDRRSQGRLNEAPIAIQMYFYKL